MPHQRGLTDGQDDESDNVSLEHHRRAQAYINDRNQYAANQEMTTQQRY